MPVLRTVPALLLAALLASCGSASPDSSGTADTVQGSPVLRWGEGAYGVVLAHGASYDAASWQQEAAAIAELGMSVVAVESITPEAIQAAVEDLQSDGVREVALMGGSAGADAILELAGREPRLPDQLILLSPNTSVAGLGSEPVLVIASEDEPLVDVAREVVDSAPGDHNDLLLVPGSRHAQGILTGDPDDPVLQRILDRLADHGS